MLPTIKKLPHVYQVIKHKQNLKKIHLSMDC